VVFFTTEVDTLAAPTPVTIMCVASPIAAVVNSTRKLPKLVTKDLSTVMNIAIIAFPVVAGKFNVAIKAVLTQVKSTVSFTQLHFGIALFVIVLPYALLT
jgi:hypothetical protein